MKVFLISVSAIAAIVGIIIVAFVIQWGTAPVRGKLAAREQIYSGSNRIVSYNHFFDLCAAVQSDEVRLEAQYQELTTATGEDIGRVNANIAGIESDRADAINQYNADASKSYTIGQFRSSHLPYQLSTDTYQKGTHTSCAS